MLVTQAMPYSIDGIQVEVGVKDPTSDPNSATIEFGTSTRATVGKDHFRPGAGVVASVSIGGVSSHSTSKGRQRAHAYLVACDLADQLQQAITALLASVGTNPPDDVLADLTRNLAEKYDGLLYDDNGVRLYV